MIAAIQKVKGSGNVSLNYEDFDDDDNVDNDSNDNNDDNMFSGSWRLQGSRKDGVDLLWGQWEGQGLFETGDADR